MCLYWHPGTGTVMVRLTDVNDNSPKLSRSEYHLEIPETWGRGPPEDVALLDLAVTDADVTNYFFYRVSLPLQIFHVKFEIKQL